jgi:hypothetical protein
MAPYRACPTLTTARGLAYACPTAARLVTEGGVKSPADPASGRSWALSDLLRTAWTTRRPTLVLLRIVLNVIGAAWFTYALARGWSIAGFDAVSYWLIEPADLYRWTESSHVAGPFRYSPVLGQVLDPLGALPWGAFFSLYLAASLLALVLLGGRWGLAFLLIPNVLGEVYLGNIDLFIAAALGFGLVWPGAWVFLVLSKGTPGIVVLWFVARGEWRKLAIVVGGVVLVALPSLLTTPDLWVEWVRVSTQFAGSAYGISEIPAVTRLVGAALLVLVGARRNWRWTIAVGGTLAMPGLDWKTMSVLLAVLPLYGLGLRADWPAIRLRLPGR